MPFVTCLCGKRLEGPDGQQISDVFWTHTAEAHADVRVSDVRRAEVTAAIVRTGGWDGKRLDLDEVVEIKPLGPPGRDDYLRFFDEDAFPDNPVWSRCYCLSYHLLPKAGEDFDERSGSQNRAERSEMIERGEATGVMAYSGGRVAGWCNAAPRTSHKLLDLYPEFSADDPETSGSIVCFVIAPAYRGQGLARKLLDGACDILGDRGLKTVYAYPPKTPGTDAGSYHGKLSMYLAAGFEETGAGNSRYTVVRRSLA